jgi:polyhydroxyalkanoate synthesis regulator phasin
MAYSTAQRWFEANATETPSPDVQTNIALNLSKGLSELTVSVAADIQDLRAQLRVLRKELDDLKAERRRLTI